MHHKVYKDSIVMDMGAKKLNDNRLGKSMDKNWVYQRLNAATASNERGDHDLNPGFRPEVSLRPAAVMVGLVERGDTMNVLLTRRTDNLEHHPGQISFPGGHIEEEDLDATAAAIRETHEETGISPKCIEIIGSLDTYITRTGFSVEPVVGIISPPFDISPDPSEVAEVFEVPLAHFLNPANHQRSERNFEGNMRMFYAMPYGEYYIWGATAGMLFNLYQVLGNEP